jgi:UDP-glucose 4-epimerase
MKRILVTGGCGFVGSNLLRQVVERDGVADIVVFDNETMGSPRDLPAGNIAYHKGDICDLPLLGQVMAGCDTVIHLAANTRVIESIEDPTLNFEVNVRGTFNVLLAARDAGVQRVVMASTGGAILGDVEPPVHEGMVPQPAAPYGASKLAGEGYGSAFAGSYGMQVTALRFSNVYGPRSYRKGSAVAHFFKQVLDGKPITVYGDGSQIRDFVFVGDLCRGILQALDADVSGVFQLGSGKPTSINELLVEMKQVVGPERWPDVHYADWRAGEVRRTYCDIAKARDGFKFDPATPLSAGLEKTWQWFLSQTAAKAVSAA